ncbi:TPA: AbrB/MazE/SpoVT family DNA-binding domain-containing protein [Candidatus Woesearchaeota archaeon]|nr:AbrB/MazE/SpoVT family DNA-binding domain-containing protein [Candidatus Woesearchaeota archaeon]
MTTEIHVKMRKWGDSLAVILPSEIVKKEKLQVNDDIHLILQKETDLSDLFGTWKSKKTPLELKNESREAWD